MAVSPIALLRERNRQSFASDRNFFRKFIMFFELRLPSVTSPVGNLEAGGTFFFPIVRGPSNYSMSEPFTVQETPTQGGGLYVEENGIVMRTIRIAGTTGFSPRSLPQTSVTPLVSLKPEKRSFSRRLRTRVLTDLSGHMHFMYLQDAVFRTYADFKRDPATAEETQMIFHNPKDQESWLVVPKVFEVAREAKDRGRTQYPYSFELTAVDAAKTTDRDFSEDKGLLDSLKDAVGTIDRGINLARGAVNDLVALRASLTGLVPDLSSILDGATEILDAAADFVSGTVDAIQIPFPSVAELADVVDSSMDALDSLIEAGEAIARVPDEVIQKFRQIGDGLDVLGTHPESFETPAQRELREVRQSQELLRAISVERADEAAATDPPTTFSAVDELGTGVTQGDVTSAGGTVTVGGAVIEYTSTTDHVIGRGDTLTNLAAKYLGDARLWQQIAVVNGLRPPFISELANVDLSEENLPGTLGVGQTILIPTFAKPPSSLPVLPVLGVTSEEPAEVHLLGTDLALEVVGGRAGAPLFDFVVDVEGGSRDAKQVSGRDNMAQAIQQRILTEKGTDILYKRLGLGRVVGTNFLPTDVEASRIKFAEAVDQDPRVASVRRLDFDDDRSPLDSLTLDMDVELRGFSAAVNVKTVL